MTYCLIFFSPAFIIHALFAGSLPGCTSSQKQLRSGVTRRALPPPFPVRQYGILRSFVFIARRIQHFLPSRPLASNCTSLLSHPIYFFIFLLLFSHCSPLALPPSSNSDPGSHSGPSSPFPSTVRAFHFYRGYNSASSYLSSTRVELCLPTLLSALNG